MCNQKKKKQGRKPKKQKQKQKQTQKTTKQKAVNISPCYSKPNRLTSKGWKYHPFNGSLFDSN
jgi:hypothetical protein